MRKLDFEEFQEINEVELTCIFAESGADRELDFDLESEIGNLYEEGFESSTLKKYPQLQFLIEDDKLLDL